MKKILALAVAKLVHLAARLRGGGSAFPGVILLKLWPNVLSETLGSLQLGVVFVSGSNGKSTTTAMISNMLRAHGLQVFSNSAGGNLPQGLAAAIVASSSILGKVKADVAVLEVDEAFGPQIAASLQPGLVVLTNLQVDQLNRFGEPENVYEMLKSIALRASKGLFINGADLNLANLGGEIAQSGIEVNSTGVSPALFEKSMDSAVSVSSEWLVDPSSLMSPKVTLIEAEGALAKFAFEDSHVTVKLPRPGLHYALDATLAISLVMNLLGDRADISLVEKSLSQSVPVFGRGEKISFRGAEIELVMMKNLPSMQANIRALDSTPELVWMSMDEGTPDPSWLYELDLCKIESVDVVSGSKAWLLAIFLLYRGIPCGQIIEDTAQALAAVSSLAGERNANVTAIINYEQMMIIRRLAGLRKLETRK